MFKQFLVKGQYGELKSLSSFFLISSCDSYSQIRFDTSEPKVLKGLSTGGEKLSIKDYLYGLGIVWFYKVPVYRLSFNAIPEKVEELLDKINSLMGFVYSWSVEFI